jgi:hypothetical protein
LPRAFPHGFSLNEIEQIKLAQKSSIVDAWTKGIQLASAKVGSPKKRRREHLTPSVLRKKSTSPLVDQTYFMPQ